MSEQDAVERNLDTFLVPDAPAHLVKLFQNDVEFNTLVRHLERAMHRYGRTTIHDALWMADLINKRRMEERL